MSKRISDLDDVTDLATFSVAGIQGTSVFSNVKGKLLSFFREKLTANRTYFVATTGSDSNDGRTAGTPFATVQKAWDTICTTLDLAGNTAIISVADGTYTAGLLAASRPLGGNIQIQGNASNASAVTFNIDGASNGFTVNVILGNILVIRDLRIQGASNGIVVQAESAVQLINVVFNNVSANCLYLANGARGALAGAITFSGTNGYGLSVLQESSLVANAIPITFSAGVSFTTSFVYCFMSGFARVSSITFTGTFTGKRFVGQTNGNIYTGTENLNYFPGSVAGTLASNAMYDSYTAGATFLGTITANADLAVDGLIYEQSHRLVRKDGDTMTGQLTVPTVKATDPVAGTGVISADTSIAGKNAGLWMYNQGNPRWALYKHANTDSGNAGSDLRLDRFDDAGAATNIATISRANGVITLASAVALDNTTVPGITGKTSGTPRWMMTLGAGAGQDLWFTRYDDSGVGIDVPFQISRNTGQLYLGKELQLVGGRIIFPTTAILSSNANTLDDYEEGSWVPDLMFGGANTGITYSATRRGYYTKVGNAVLFMCEFQLTSKGTATGNATIGGLPFSVANISPVYAGQGHPVSLPAGGAGTFCLVSGTALTLYYGNTTGNPAHTDATFLSNTIIRVGGYYQTTG